jgi:tRNA(Ile2) C34 agmatinyltransferase TiaS
MTDETQTAWKCPKDGTPMQPQGRRSGAWRCPTCKGMLVDTEAMRQGQPRWWSPILTSVVMGLVARAGVRHVRRRAHTQSPS